MTCADGNTSRMSDHNYADFDIVADSNYAASARVGLLMWSKRTQPWGPFSLSVFIGYLEFHIFRPLVNIYVTVAQVGKRMGRFINIYAS